MQNFSTTIYIYMYVCASMKISFCLVENNSKNLEEKKIIIKLNSCAEKEIASKRKGIPR